MPSHRENNHSTNDRSMDRREFCTAGARMLVATVVAAAGCRSQQPQSPHRLDLQEVLRGYHFIDDEGQPFIVGSAADANANLNAAALGRRLGGRPTVVLAGFAGCEDYCKPNLHILGCAVREMRPHPVNIILLNVRPDKDGVSEQTRTRYRQKVMAQLGISDASDASAHVTILYPTRNGAVSYESALLVPKIMTQRMGLKTNPGDPEQHSSTFVLYGPDLREIHRVPSAKLEDPRARSAWTAPIIASTRHAGQSR